MIKSEFFNRREHVIKLYEYLCKQHPIQEDSVIDKEVVFKKVFKTAYQPKKWEDTVYHLSNQIEDYLIWEKNSTDKRSRFNSLLEIYHQKDAVKLIQSEGNKALSFFQKDKKDLNYGLDLFKIHFMNYANGIQTSLYNKESHQGLDKAMSYAQLWFLTNQLFIRGELQAQYNIFDFDFATLSINEADKWFREVNIPTEELNVSKHLYELSKLYQTPVWQSYLPLEKKVLADNSMDDQLKLHLIRALINLCNIFYGKGEKDALNHWFKLYQYIVEQDLLSKEGKINEASFLNIIHLGCALKEFDWVGKFIDSHANKVENEDVFRIGKANYAFHTQDYEQVSELLLFVEFGLVHQNLNARTLLCKTNFMQQDFDLLQNNLNAFEAYLRRHTEIQESLRTQFLNFVLFLKKLNPLHLHDKGYKHELKQKLNENKLIAHKLWLSEMLS